MARAASCLDENSAKHHMTSLLLRSTFCTSLNSCTQLQHPPQSASRGHDTTASAYAPIARGSSFIMARTAIVITAGLLRCRLDLISPSCKPVLTNRLCQHRDAPPKNQACASRSPELNTLGDSCSIAETMQVLPVRPDCLLWAITIP